LAAVEVAPSPKVQLYVREVPSGSEDPELEKETGRGAIPERGEPFADTIGGWLTGGAGCPLTSGCGYGNAV